MEAQQAKGAFESLQLLVMHLLPLLYRQAEHLDPGSLTYSSCKLCMCSSRLFV